MYVLSAFRYWSADLENYILGYERSIIVTSSRYSGFGKFMEFFRSNGFEFDDFMKIFYIVVLMCMFIAIIQCTKNVNQVLSLYLIYSYGLDVIQMKTMIAEALALLSLCIYFSRLDGIEIENNRLNKIKIIVFSGFLLLLSCSFHFSMVIIFLIWMFFVFIKNYRNLPRKILVVMLVSLVLVYLGFAVWMVQYASMLGVVGELDYLLQWTEKSTNYGYFLSIGFIILYLFVRNQLLKIKSISINSVQNSNINIFLNTVIFLIPFLVLHMEFLRLFRIYMILLYIVYSNIERKSLQSSSDIARRLCFYFYLLLCFMNEPFAFYEWTLGALFKFNSLFN